MRKYLIALLSVLAVGVAGLSLAPAASAGPFCSAIDIFLGPMCEAYQECSNNPDACEQYAPPPSTEPQYPRS
jgi:hypothetical protein